MELTLCELRGRVGVFVDCQQTFLPKRQSWMFMYSLRLARCLSPKCGKTGHRHIGGSRHMELGLLSGGLQGSPATSARTAAWPVSVVTAGLAGERPTQGWDMSGRARGADKVLGSLRTRLEFQSFPCGFRLSLGLLTFILLFYVDTITGQQQHRCSWQCKPSRNLCQR